MSDKKGLIKPDEIKTDSLTKKTKKVKRNNDIVERSDDKIMTDDGKELLT